MRTLCTVFKTKKNIMGTINKIKCHQCGYEFERRYGIGILGRGTLYCDKCGKATNVDFSYGWNPLDPCECGGTYDAAAMGTCPQCHALISKEDIDANADIIQWD